MIVILALFLVLGGIAFLFGQYVKSRKESIFPEKEEPKDPKD